MRFFSILFFLLLFGFNMVFAQTSFTDEERMEAAVSTIKKGGLVILLPTKTKTINALEEALTGKDLSQKNQIQFTKRLDNTKSIVKRDQEWLITFFARFYTSGDTYFIYDTNFKKLKEGIPHGYFLDKNLEINSTINCPDNFLIVRKSIPNQVQYTTGDALIVYDSKGNDLPPLFPSVSPLWGMGLSKDRVDFMRYRNSVKKLSLRFERMIAAYD